VIPLLQDTWQFPLLHLLHSSWAGMDLALQAALSLGETQLPAGLQVPGAAATGMSLSPGP
jgi:hypothetical protein